MNFIYSAIGDNTHENREHLEKLGYNEYIHLDLKNEPKYILTDIDDRTYFYDSWLEDSDINDYINCIGNDPLFQAVTAMKDDNDYMQWFKTDFENTLIPDVKEMYLCKSREFCGITVKYKGEDFVIGSAGFHKATLAELQEHFKRVYKTSLSYT